MWQLIETAPECKNVLVWNGQWIEIGGYWDGWIEANRYGEKIWPPPTHWMLIPAPPITEPNKARTT